MLVSEGFSGRVKKKGGGGGFQRNAKMYLGETMYFHKHCNATAQLGESD